MLFFRALCLPLLGAALLALPGTTQKASAQTAPKTKVARKPAPRPARSASSATRSADAQQGSSDSGSGNNGYAAPGEPINVQQNGKNTPPYDGPAAKSPGRTKTTLATPK